MSGESQLMLMIAGVHLLGLGCVAVLMIPALRGPQKTARDPGQGADDGGGSDRRAPERPSPPRPGTGPPLPDGKPARVRLRDHRRLGELLPRRQRRPGREPRRRPVRT